MKNEELLKRNGFLNAWVKYLQAYEVRGHNDTTEGRQGTHLIGYFNHRGKADEAAADKGVWGSPGEVNSVQLVEISFADGTKVYYLDKPVELKSVTDEELRAKALAKLSAEDKKILGIK